jgi:hypothetical protein
MALLIDCAVWELSLLSLDPNKRKESTEIEIVPLINSDLSRDSLPFVFGRDILHHFNEEN